MLAAADIAYPLRKIAAEYDGFETKRAEVVAIDPAARTVTTRHGETYTGDYHRPGGRLPAELLRDTRGRARLPALLARRRGPPQDADHPGLRGGRQRPAPRRRGRPRLRRRRRRSDRGRGRRRPVRDDQDHDDARVHVARAAGQGPSRRPRDRAAEDVPGQGPRLRGTDPREGRRRPSPGGRREGHRSRSRHPVGRHRRSRRAASSGAAA